MKHSHYTRTSDILKEVIASCESASITLGDFMVRLEDRGFALAILILALPNVVLAGAIPGFSTVTGLPMVFIAAQMLMGKNTLWLPKSIAKIAFSEQALATGLTKAVPLVLWTEKWLKPRWTPLCGPNGERVLGLFFIVLAFVLSLPMPGGNFLPSFSIMILALALLENDGIAASIGAIISIASVVILYKVIEIVVSTGYEWLIGLF